VYVLPSAAVYDRASMTARVRCSTPFIRPAALRRGSSPPVNGFPGPRPFFGVGLPESDIA
jgi:hypothetical protein